MSLIMFPILIFGCMFLQSFCFRKFNRPIQKYLPTILCGLCLLFAGLVYLISCFFNIQSGLLAYGTFALYFVMLFMMCVAGCIVGFFIKDNLIYYIAVVIAAIFYGIIILLGGIKGIHSGVWLALLSMYSASVLMDRGKWYGCFVYAIIGFGLIYMGMQETGQIVKEWPLGIVWLVYSCFSGYVSYRKNRGSQNGISS